MSTVKERTCSDPNKWNIIKKTCTCPACRSLYNEYQRNRYHAMKNGTAVDPAKRSEATEEWWQSRANSGKATRCPICTDWTMSESGFCKKHSTPESRL